MTTCIPTIEKATAIAQHIEERKNFFRAKADRARSQKSRSEHWTRYSEYRDFFPRAYNLVLNLRHNKKFGEARFSFLTLTSDEYKKRKADRIARGKEKFEKLHTYSPWFFGTGLHQDYGSFKCSRCERVFYHSPSTIKKAGKVLFKCACGYCTNEIISSDYNETPFE